MNLEDTRASRRARGGSRRHPKTHAQHRSGRATLAGPGWAIAGVGAVLFDKDGTIVDLHRYWGEIIRRRARAIVAHHGWSESLIPEICLGMGLSPAGLLLPEGPTGLASREEIIHALCARLATRGLVCSERVLAGVFVAVHERFLPEIGGFLELLPGVAAFAGALKGAGVRTAIVTSDTVASTGASLELLGVGQLFDLVVGRDSTIEPKISGVPARRAMEGLGVGGGETICLGDAPMDVVMGREAGCRATVAVATGQIPFEALRKQTPYVALSLQEITVTAGG